MEINKDRNSHFGFQSTFVVIRVLLFQFVGVSIALSVIVELCVSLGEERYVCLYFNRVNMAAWVSEEDVDISREGCSFKRHYV